MSVHEILVSLAPYARAAADSLPPQILPWEHDHPWGLDGAARAGLQRLGDVQQYLDVRAQIVETESALAAFPPGLDRLRGNEGDQLRDINEDLSRQEELLTEASARAQEARALISEAALPEEGIAEILLAEQRSRLSELSVLSSLTGS